MYLTKKELEELKNLAEQKNKDGWSFFKNGMGWYSSYEDLAGRTVGE